MDSNKTQKLFVRYLCVTSRCARTTTIIPCYITLCIHVRPQQANFSRSPLFFGRAALLLTSGAFLSSPGHPKESRNLKRYTPGQEDEDADRDGDQTDNQDFGELGPGARTDLDGEGHAPPGGGSAETADRAPAWPRGSAERATPAAGKPSCENATHWLVTLNGSERFVWFR